MDPYDPCRFCGGRRVPTGRFVELSGFAPADLEVPFWRFSPRILPMSDDAALCLDCGMVWAQGDAARARDRAERFGSAGLEERLGIRDPPRTAAADAGGDGEAS